MNNLINNALTTKIIERIESGKHQTLIQIPAAGGKTTAAAAFMLRFITDDIGDLQGGIYCTETVSLLSEAYDKTREIFIGHLGEVEGEKLFNESIIPVLSHNEIKIKYHGITKVNTRNNENKDDKMKDYIEEFQELNKDSAYSMYLQKTMSNLDGAIDGFNKSNKVKKGNSYEYKYINGDLFIPDIHANHDSREEDEAWSRLDNVCHKRFCDENEDVPENIIRDINIIRSIIFPFDKVDNKKKVYLCTQDKLLYPMKVYNYIIDNEHDDSKLLKPCSKVRPYVSKGFSENLFNVKRIIDERKFFLWIDEADIMFNKIFKKGIAQSYGSSKEITAALQCFYIASYDITKLKNNLETGIDNYDDLIKLPENENVFKNIDFIFEQMNKLTKRFDDFLFKYHNLNIGQNLEDDESTKTTVFTPCINNMYVNNDIYFYSECDKLDINENYYKLDKKARDKISINFDITLEELKMFYQSYVILLSMFVLELTKIKNLLFKNYSDGENDKKTFIEKKFIEVVYEHMIEKNNSKLNCGAIYNYLASNNYSVYISEKKIKEIQKYDDYYDYLKNNNKEDIAFTNYSCDYLKKEIRTTLADFKYYVNEDTINPDNTMYNLMTMNNGYFICSSATLLQDNNYNNFNWLEIYKKLNVQDEDVVLKQEGDDDLFYTPIKDLNAHVDIIDISKKEEDDNNEWNRLCINKIIDKTKEIINNNKELNGKQALLILGNRNLYFNVNNIFGDDIEFVTLTKVYEDNTKSLREAKNNLEEKNKKLLVIYSSYANCGRGKNVEEMLGMSIHFNAIISMSYLMEYAKPRDYTLDDKWSISEYTKKLQYIRLADNYMKRNKMDTAQNIIKKLSEEERGHNYRCDELAYELLVRLEQYTARIARKDFSNDLSKDSKDYYFLITTDTLNKFNKNQQDLTLFKQAVDVYCNKTNSILFKKILEQLKSKAMIDDKKSSKKEDKIQLTNFQVDSNDITHVDEISYLERYKKNLMGNKNKNSAAQKNLNTFKNAPIVKDDSRTIANDKKVQDYAYVKGSDLIGKITFEQDNYKNSNNRESHYRYAVTESKKKNTYNDLLDEYQKYCEYLNENVNIKNPEDNPEEYYIIPSILKYDLIPEKAEKLSRRLIGELLSSDYAIDSLEKCPLLTDEQKLKSFEFADSCIYKVDSESLDKIVCIDHKRYKDIFAIQDKKEDEIKRMSEIFGIDEDKILYLYTNIHIKKQEENVAFTEYDIPNLIDERGMRPLDVSGKIKNIENWLSKEE